MSAVSVINSYKVEPVYNLTQFELWSFEVIKMSLIKTK